jgi:hypothetical protein
LFLHVLARLHCPYPFEHHEWYLVQVAFDDGYGLNPGPLGVQFSGPTANCMQPNHPSFSILWNRLRILYGKDFITCSILP